MLIEVIQQRNNRRDFQQQQLLTSASATNNGKRHHVVDSYDASRDVDRYSEVVKSYIAPKPSTKPTRDIVSNHRTRVPTQYFEYKFPYCFKT